MKVWIFIITGLFFAGIGRADPSGAAGANAAPKTSGPAANRTFAVRGYVLEGNTLLPPAKIDSILTNYIGPAIDVPTLQEGLAKLQLLYRHLGFATVNVALPQQKLTNGLVRVKVTEGRLSGIVVKGNRYYSAGNIRRALPSLTTNIILNNQWFQPELNRANANQDRQIYPVIGPGPDPGTTELTLKVKDQLPLHGHLEINDRSPADTPLLRVDASVQYDNLWQRNHELGFNYNFSPQQMKSQDDEPRFYDQPEVASYSAYYRLPLGNGGGLRAAYEHEPLDFGYNEVTHAFTPAPASGNPDLIFYASRSASDTPLRYGPLSVIFTNTDADLTAQSAQRSATYNGNLGAKLTWPLRDLAGIKSSLLLGIDFKAYEAPSFSTNLSYFSLYDLDQYGNRTVVTNATISLPANETARLSYLPLSISWKASRPDPWGNTSFDFNQNIFLAALASQRTNFQTVAGTAAAGGNYTDITAGLNRLQNLPHGWSLLGRLNGQWTSAPLIANEQMALGGTSGVRGYREGEIYGDEGWRGLLDLNAPALQVGSFPLANQQRLPAMLRCSVFTDYGSACLIDRPSASDLNYAEWGAGAGAFLTAGEHFYARLSVAWALKNTPTTQAGSARAYFAIGLQF